MPTVLVTGAAGSVGRELVNLLSSRGIAVRAFDLASCDFSPFQGLPQVSIWPCDITDALGVAEAVAGVDSIVHLAALLPPASERDRSRTFLINVAGTQNLIAATQISHTRPHLIFASSVSTYGDTSKDTPPISTQHSQSPLDIYAESKIAGEGAVLASGLPYTILRIAGISVPLVLEPPPVWPFQIDQRIEFVSRHDVVVALAASVGNREAVNKVFNIAGGPSWQMRGQEYVESQYKLLDIPPEEARYADAPGWFDWYDTTEAQAALNYQQTSYDQFLAQLQQAIEEEFA
jgi:nucleoside-diphosphate-sugar epimerase